jgi:hypothetical protein
LNDPGIPAWGIAKINKFRQKRKPGREFRASAECGNKNQFEFGV